jgi:hypothetical protein
MNVEYDWISRLKIKGEMTQIHLQQICVIKMKINQLSHELKDQSIQLLQEGYKQQESRTK